MSDLPVELKPLKRFIREAKKSQKISPVIAYFCRLYAIQEAMKLDDSKKTPATKQWLSVQLTQLETCKTDVTRDQAQQQITNMAHNVFKHADTVDRAGDATKQTAAAFNSAYVFYEILKQFGDRDEEIVSRAKYCMFKTSDILRALKQGRKPHPGPPGDEGDGAEAELNALEAEMGGSNNIPGSSDPGAQNPGWNNNSNASPPPNNQGWSNPNASPPPNNYAQNQNQNQNQFQNQNQNQNQYRNQAQNQNQNQWGQGNQSKNQQQAPQKKMNTSNYMVDAGQQYNYQKQMQLPHYEKRIEACMAAEKIFKEAMGALRFEDVDTAIKKAEEAVAILKRHR